MVAILASVVVLVAVFLFWKRPMPDIFRFGLVAVATVAFVIIAIRFME